MTILHMFYMIRMAHFLEWCFLFSIFRIYAATQENWKGYQKKLSVRIPVLVAAGWLANKVRHPFPASSQQQLVIARGNLLVSGSQSNTSSLAGGKQVANRICSTRFADYIKTSDVQISLLSGLSNYQNKISSRYNQVGPSAISSEYNMFTKECLTCDTFLDALHSIS